MRRTNWFDRTIPAIEDNGLLPGIIERLNGTPARLTEKTGNLSDHAYPQLHADKWSLKKEIGHLTDLEPLWHERLLQIIDDNPNMTVADLTNRKTHETLHDEKTFKELITGFKQKGRSLSTNCVRCVRTSSVKRPFIRA
jgi:hypothetical protein